MSISAMGTPIRAGEQDLRALAAIVSQDRPDLPDGEGLLPPSLLADLVGQIRCDGISVEHYDTGRQVHTWLQGSDGDGDAGTPEGWAQVFWSHYWDCRVCAYPVRTGDLRSVVMTSDFYSMRQWHSSGMYIDCIGPQGIERHLMLALPELPELPGRPRRPGGICGWSCTAAPARTSPSGTGRCWSWCARTCTRPAWTPNGAGIRSTGLPPGRTT